MGLTNSHNSDKFLKEYVNYDFEIKDKFWTSFRRVPVPGDGHCLLHAITKSMSSQFKNYEVNKSKLIQLLEDETMKNIDNYKYFSPDMCKESIMEGLYLYAKHRVYKTDFGDMVPRILRNALNVDLLIITKCDNKIKATVADGDNINEDIGGVLCIYKEGEHYDALVKRDVYVSMGITTDSSQQQSNPCQTDMDENVSTQDIKICFWNIDGLTQNKPNDHLLGKFLKMYDLILIAETWADKHDDFFLDGYTFTNYPRGYRNPYAKRCSGGLGIFIRNDILNGVEMIKHFEDIIAWLKLKKDFFGIERDIYISNVYFVPEGSVHLKNDPFVMLYNDVSSLPDDCEILCCEDYNARTNNLLDFTDPVDGSDGSLGNLLPSNSKILSQIDTVYGGKPPLRVSKDKSRPNSHGISLIELCKSCELLILNGRTGADKDVGEFTRVDTTGKSVVDYAIASPTLAKSIQSFSVHSKLPESDHRPILFSIGVMKSAHRTSMGLPGGWADHHRYLWSHSDLHIVKNALHDLQSNQYKAYVLDTLVSQSGTDIVAHAMNQYLSQALDRVCPRKASNHQRFKNGPRWYDRELRNKRSAAVKAGEQAAMCGDNTMAFRYCREYRSARQRKERAYKKQCLSKIEHSYFNDRGNMWKTLNDITGDTYISEGTPCAQDFYEYFSNVSKTANVSYLTYCYEDEAK